MKLRVLLGTLALLAAATMAAFLVSPWPSVWVIRAVFDAGARRASDALAARVPAHVRTTADLHYDPDDPDAVLDIHRGDGATAAGPTVVWFHGGGFISGRRSDVSNYLKILAGRGFVVVNVDYTIAPEAIYPTPIRQANRALAYLAANASRLGLNGGKFVLAGDSAGAQIAAQTAAMLTHPAYARALGIRPGVPAASVAGTLLHCGAYDVTAIGKGGGVLGWFVRSTTWAYSGHRDWRDAPGFADMSIPPHVTAAFPPTFISAGNADPLGPQSVVLADTLKARGVAVTPLFFPADYQPPLGHEYQFDLATEAGTQALDASSAWLREL